MDVSLTVGNLTPGITECELEVLFSQAGTVMSVRLLDELNLAPCRALVTMTSHAAAQHAIDQLHQAELTGSAITVTYTPTRRATDNKPTRLRSLGQADRSGQGELGRPGQSGSSDDGPLSAVGSSQVAPPPAHPHSVSQG